MFFADNNNDSIYNIIINLFILIISLKNKLYQDYLKIILKKICIIVPYLLYYASVAQLVEHYLAKVIVEGSNPFTRFLSLFVKIIKMSKIKFFNRNSIEQVEESDELAPRFPFEGLLPVITLAHQTGEPLMLGFMNEEALKQTIELGEAVYFSRTRQALWHKGKTSGLIQKVTEILIDDDQDAIVLRVKVHGKASCHVGYRSCFYRSISFGENCSNKLTFTENKKVFDPKKVYGDTPNPTIL